MRLEAELGLSARPLDHAGKSSGAERRSALRREHEGRPRFLFAFNRFFDQ
jgi:hypothetical protein